MEQGDTKKEQYHYKIGELAMDILADDKYAFTPAGKMENARKLTETDPVEQAAREVVEEKNKKVLNRVCRMISTPRLLKEMLRTIIR